MGWVHPDHSTQKRLRRIQEDHCEFKASLSYAMMGGGGRGGGGGTGLLLSEILF